MDVSDSQVLDRADLQRAKERLLMIQTNLTSSHQSALSQEARRKALERLGIM